MFESDIYVNLTKVGQLYQQSKCFECIYAVYRRNPVFLYFM